TIRSMRSATRMIHTAFFNSAIERAPASGRSAWRQTRIAARGILYQGHARHGRLLLKVLALAIRAFHFVAAIDQHLEIVVAILAGAVVERHGLDSLPPGIHFAHPVA